MSQEVPGEVRRNQEELGEARRNQEELGEARRCQEGREEPGGTRREPGASMRRREPVDEAIHFPRFIAIAVSFQKHLKPCQVK